MRKKRDDENGDRIDQFGNYTGPTIVAVLVLVAVIVVILVLSSSPRVGIATVGVMLLAIFGIAGIVYRLTG
ncbi:MAG: hypothetical protein ACM3IH_21085 [Sphingobacteriales bacterium]|jgi:hypothetical protein